jgi:hypothetical protein
MVSTRKLHSWKPSLHSNSSPSEPLA